MSDQLKNEKIKNLLADFVTSKPGLFSSLAGKMDQHPIQESRLLSLLGKTKPTSLVDAIDKVTTSIYSKFGKKSPLKAATLSVDLLTEMDRFLKSSSFHLFSKKEQEEYQKKFDQEIKRLKHAARSELKNEQDKSKIKPPGLSLKSTRKTTPQTEQKTTSDNDEQSYLQSNKEKLLATKNKLQAVLGYINAHLSTSVDNTQLTGKISASLDHIDAGLSAIEQYSLQINTTAQVDSVETSPLTAIGNKLMGISHQVPSPLSFDNVSSKVSTANNIDVSTLLKEEKLSIVNQHDRIELLGLDDVRFSSPEPIQV